MAPRRQIRCAGWLALSMLLALPDSAPADDIVLGMSAAFKGPSRGLGIEVYRGAMAWFREVNHAGGVHGRRIVLRAYDDGYSPPTALANTRRLVHEDHAFLLFGYVGTPTVTRVLPLLKHFEAESIYLFCPFTGAGPLRQGPYRQFVFNLRASYHDETKGLVDHFVAVGRKRIAIFYQIDSYGRSGWDGVRHALAARGLKMTGEATYLRGARFAESMTRQVEILRRGEPDAVISVGAYAACAAFIRDARDAGWDVPIANLSFVGSGNLLELLRVHGLGKDRDYTTRLVNSQVVPSHDRTELAGVKLYRGLMDKYAREPMPEGLTDDKYEPLRYSSTSLEGFLGARLVVEVLRKLGPNPKRSEVCKVAESLKDVDLGVGPAVSFTAERHQAANQVYYSVAEEGKFVPLTDWSRFKR